MKDDTETADPLLHTVFIRINAPGQSIFQKGGGRLLPL